MQTGYIPTQLSGIIFPGIRRGHEADRLPLSNTEIKNHISYDSTKLYAFIRIMNRELPVIHFTIHIINRNYFLLEHYNIKGFHIL